MSQCSFFLPRGQKGLTSRCVTDLRCSGASCQRRRSPVRTSLLAVRFAAPVQAATRGWMTPPRRECERLLLSSSRRASFPAGTGRHSVAATCLHCCCRSSPAAGGTDFPVPKGWNCAVKIMGPSNGFNNKPSGHHRCVIRKSGFLWRIGLV